MGNQPLENMLRENSASKILYYNAPLHWMKSFDFLPRSYNERDGVIHGSHYKEIYSSSERVRYPIIAAMNSHLFYIWFIMVGNCRDLSSREVQTFPFSVSDNDQFFKELEALAQQLMESYIDNSSVKIRMQKTTGRMELQEIDPRKSSDIIRKIDIVLGKHYGFNEEEVDFIINYDNKYRVGSSEGDEEDA